MAVKNILEKIGGLFKNINVKSTAENIADNVRKTSSKAKNAVSEAVDNVKKTGLKPKDAVTGKTPKSRQLGSNPIIGSGIVDKIPNQNARGFTSIAVNAGIGAVGGGIIGAAVAENDERTDRSKGFVAGALIGAGTMAAGTAFMNKHDLQIAKGITKDAMKGNKGVSAKATEVAEQVAGTNEAERMAAARAAFNERTGKSVHSPWKVSSPESLKDIPYGSMPNLNTDGTIITPLDGNGYFTSAEAQYFKKYLKDARGITDPRIKTINVQNNSRSAYNNITGNLSTDNVRKSDRYYIKRKSLKPTSYELNDKLNTDIPYSRILDLNELDLTDKDIKRIGVENMFDIIDKNTRPDYTTVTI